MNPTLIHSCTHTWYILYKCRKTGNHRKNDTNTNDKPTNTRQTERRIEWMWHEKPKTKMAYADRTIYVSSFVVRCLYCVWVCGYICVHTCAVWESDKMVYSFVISPFALLLKLNTQFSEHINQKKEGKNWYNTKRIENKQCRIRFGVRHSISALALLCVLECVCMQYIHECSVFNGS